MTMTLISTVTVGAGGASSIAFSSIPQTYTDLLLVLSARTASANNYSTVVANINNDATLNRYTFRQLYGTGNTVGSGNGSIFGGPIGDVPGANATASTFGNASIYYPNYAGSSQKSYSADTVTENNATAASQSILACVYNQTTAISSLNLYVYDTTNFAQNTTASLYGILKGSGGATVS